VISSCISMLRVLRLRVEDTALHSCRIQIKFNLKGLWNGLLHDSGPAFKIYSQVLDVASMGDAAHASHTASYLHPYSLPHHGFCLAVLGLRWGQFLFLCNSLSRNWDTRLHSGGTCGSSPVEATSSTYEEQLECWSALVEKSVFQYVTRIKRKMKLN
jgi:hypothetical protein